MLGRYPTVSAVLCGCVLVVFCVKFLLRGPSAGLSSGSIVYSVVFDAGSTGSRVHVYSFKVVNSKLELLNDDFHQLKPGLSSYAGDPPKAVDSLRPLLQNALDAVPADQRAQTSCELRATAGLRLLEGSQANDILDAVATFLKESPFKVVDSSVSILDGQDEGAYAWLTLNYLLGRLGKDPAETVAAVDLGGGSVQASYAVPESKTTCGPKGYIQELKGGGKTYHVYVHSYLNFGLMAARAEVLKSNSNGTPCLAEGFSGQYVYGGKNYPAKGSADGMAGGPQCREFIEDVLEVKTPCEAPKEQCSFKGAWGGPVPQSGQQFYLFSYFWDRAEDFGIIDKEDAYDWKLNVSEYGGASDMVCGLSQTGLKDRYPEIGEEHLPYLCMDLSYCSVLLSKGFGFQEEEVGNLVKRIKYGTKEIEVAWTLGAAINSLG
ncbi:hypothetical protein BSKO_00097 [Bryopsis sp. KO-2023]|nr:hypothetical protein BSKO_00097 [Bryopsis sp. KO-2023]